jgi:hypothetical protein
MALGAPDRAELLAALGGFVQTSARVGNPRLRLHSEAHVVAVLARLLLQHDTVVRSKAVSDRRIGALEDWSESHLDEPITLGRLCGVADIG